MISAGQNAPTMGRSNRSIRVLIVDDSSTMRRMVRESLGRDPSLEVIGEASHPLEARESVKALKPDVLTLDVEMPHMNGLDFLKRLMARRPMPVVMLSSLTRAGSRAAVEALALGAVDCIEKPCGQGDTLADLHERVRMAANANLSGHGQAPRPARASSAPTTPTIQPAGPLNGRIVCIGASTGGVDALQRVLTRIPPDGPPILITQHMPEGFLRSFTSRLNPLCSVEIKLAETGMPLEPGSVYVAPGGNAHLKLTPDWPPRCLVEEGEKVSGHRPSVDVLFRSAVVHGSKMLGVLLTGMGRDGADGLKQMRDAGAPTVVQDEATSVVFGMPRVALEMGAADKGMPLEKIADEIMTLCTTSRDKQKRATP